MIIKIARFLIRFVLNIITKTEIHNYENVPNGGGLVIASNHLGRLDAALIYYGFHRDDFILPVAEKYEHHPLFGPLGNALGALWIDRFNPDVSALREIMQRIKRGHALIIAPEGTRSKTEALQDGKPGVVFIAAKAGVQILPVAIIGTEDRIVKENLKHLRRSTIDVYAGKPFMLASPKPGQDREKVLREQTDELMCRIAAMMPEKYHGVYANHPRLKELLREKEQNI